MCSRMVWRSGLLRRWFCPSTVWVQALGTELSCPGSNCLSPLSHLAASCSEVVRKQYVTDFLNAVLGFLRLSLPSHPDVEVRTVPCHSLYSCHGFSAAIGVFCFLFCVLMIIVIILDWYKLFLGRFAVNIQLALLNFFIFRKYADQSGIKCINSNVVKLSSLRGF